jgi:chitinase
MSASTIAAWKIGQTYAAGTLVTYDGVTYVALVGETSISAWSPTLTPTLWAVATPAASAGGGASTTGTPSAWSATAIYTTGQEASKGGTIYQANWWTEGNDPSKNNGVIGSGQPWTVVSSNTSSGGGSGGGGTSGGGSSGGGTSGSGGTSGGTSPAAWSAAAVYLAGQQALENGAIYQANWWTQGNDPATSNGAAGSGQPWSYVSGTVAVAVPSVPTGLTDPSATATTVTLKWNASNVPTGQSVTDYAVFENGKQIATTTSPLYTVTGLTASTSYSFTVDAEDSAGASAQSAALAVTTSAAGTSNAPITFAPYIDMGLLADENLDGIAQASGITTFTLAFVQSSGPGTVGWSGVGTLAQDDLSDGSSILAQVQGLQAMGGNVIISFGGEAGTDPATVASSAQQLQAEYQSVIDRYGVNSLDFDIEGAPETNIPSERLRDEALIGLKAANPGLTISFTLPVLPTGLDNNGLGVVQQAKADGLTPDVINLMTMDFGASVDNGGAMGTDVIDAVLATQQQLQALGMNSKIGITPMIGVNDVSSEIFTPADAQQIVNFALGDPSVGRIAMWSVARDNGSGAGHPWASPDNSGLSQSNYAFSKIFETV